MIMDTIKDAHDQTLLQLQETVALSVEPLAERIIGVSAHADAIENSLGCFARKLDNLTRIADEPSDTIDIKNHLMLADSRLDGLQRRCEVTEALLASAEGVSSFSAGSVTGGGPIFVDPQFPQVGMQVMLHDLKKAELNGKLGIIVSIGPERAGITIGADPKPLSLKYSNLYVVGNGTPPDTPSSSSICPPTTSTSFRSSTEAHAARPGSLGSLSC